MTLVRAGAVPAGIAGGDLCAAAGRRRGPVGAGGAGAAGGGGDDHRRAQDRRFRDAERVVPAASTRWRIWRLIGAGLNLLRGSIGVGPTILACWAPCWPWAWWAAARVVGHRRLGARAPCAGRVCAAVRAVAAVLAAGVATAEVGATLGRWSLPFDPPGTAFTARVGVERWRARPRHACRSARVRKPPPAPIPTRDAEGLLDLIDRDVIVVFIESYGRTSFLTRRCSPTCTRRRWRQARPIWPRAGCRWPRGFLRSPTRGGQS